MELIDPPSVLERRLRLRIGEMIAAQVVEDEADLQVPRGQGLYHRYNAVLKRAGQQGSGRDDLGRAGGGAGVVGAQSPR